MDKSEDDYKKAEQDEEKLAKVREALRKQAEIDAAEDEQTYHMNIVHKKAVEKKLAQRERLRAFHEDLRVKEKEERERFLQELQQQQQEQDHEHYNAHAQHGEYDGSIFTSQQINKAFKIYNAGFVGVVASIAIVLYMHNDASILMVISGFTMALSALMALNRKLLSFFWGMIGLSVHAYLSWQIHYHELTGDFILNIFNFVMQPIGFITWYLAIKRHPEISHYDESLGASDFDKILHTKVPVRRLDKRGIIIAVVCAIVMYAGWWWGALNGMYIDTFTKEKIFSHADTILNTLVVMGQFLMILRFREQWMVWIVTDIIGIYLWSHSMTPVASMQSLLLLFNSCVALYLWSKESKLADYLTDHDESELIEMKLRYGKSDKML